MLPAGDDKPTLLNLMKMKKKDGISDLKIIETVAGNYTESFGMFLLHDENGSEVEVLETDNAHKGAEAVVKVIIKTWLRKGSPDAPCTYEHLEQCLRDTGLGALADDLAAAVRGVTYLACIYTVNACVLYTV